MRRRDVICALLLSSAPWPLTAHAQLSERVRRVGLLVGGSADNSMQSDVTAFEQALNGLGWRAGTNPLVEVRWGAGDADRIRANARELIHLNPDVILVTGAALQSTAEATTTIPIVFVLTTDTIAEAHVKEFARPSGNVTGFASDESSLVGKRLELLKEVAPHTTRVAFIHSGRYSSTHAQLQRLIEASQSFGLAITDGAAENEEDIERVVTLFAVEPTCGLLVAFDAFTTAHHGKIIQLAAHYRMPAVYPFDFFANAGGLLSYGFDHTDQFRRAATYVDRILKGARLADLPAETPTKFKLIINLKTAQALGISAPPQLLAQADEVIE